MTRYAGAVLIEANSYDGIDFPMPVSQEILILAVLILLWAAVQLSRFLMIRSIDMRQISYIARFKISLPLNVTIWTGLILMLALVGRLAYYGYDLLFFNWIGGIENFWVQYSIRGLLIFLAMLTLFLTLGQIPAKVLVFDRFLLIKNLSYSSRQVQISDIAEVSLRRFKEIWLSPRIRNCRALTLGLFKPGLYLKTTQGQSYFFKVRDTDELYTILKSKFTQVSIQPSDPT